MTPEEALEARQERARKAAAAWKRCLLDEKGKLHIDGRTLVNSLLHRCQFFGPQIVLGNHDATIRLAAQRELVNEVLAALGLTKIDEQAQSAVDLITETEK